MNSQTINAPAAQTATINKIGLFGGTFDPIHLGHIEPLKLAANLLGLSSIQLIPANIPPHKEQTFSSSEHRAAMVKLICQEQPLLKFDGRELQREKPSYTLDTLTEVAQEHANHNNPVSLFFIIGMDSLIDLPLWHRWQELLTLCHLVVMPRPNYAITDISKALVPRCRFVETGKVCQYHERAGNIFIMPEVLNAISSTEIRAHIKLNKPVEQWLSANVYQYIVTEQLYR
ncbi:MAG: nicotinate-nucleotide adenylyltransferase [Thalassotalea sp.]